MKLSLKKKIVDVGWDQKNVVCSKFAI